MPIGWLELVKSKFKKPSKFNSIGIKFCKDGVYCSVFENIEGRLVWVKESTFDYRDWSVSLSDWVKQEDLDNTRCHIVLGVSLYHLLQVERPANVPDEELANALRWSIKDLVTTNEELVVDYFDLPIQTVGANKVNAVAAEMGEVLKLTSGLRDAGLDVIDVNVEELIYCDFLQNDAEPTALLMQEKSSDICMSIVKDGQIYFSRRLKGYEKIRSFSEDELRMGLVDNLALEVQRSMDYFESQLRQSPVRKIKLKLDTEQSIVICEIIQQLTQADVSELQLNIEKSEGLDIAKASYASLAAGYDEQERISEV